MSKPLCDRFGTELKAGCVIAYPGRKGSMSWIATGEVVGIYERDDYLGRTQTRIRVDGGCRGDRRQLGRRVVGWSQDVIVVKPAPRG